MSTKPPTGTGRIRYNPRAESVKYRPWWVVLSVGAGWWFLYGQWLQESLPGQWGRVIDEGRVFDGDYFLEEQARRQLRPGTWNPNPERPHHNAYRDDAPRLAFLRPELQMPKWGPHISVVRGTRPEENKDQWGHYEVERPFQFTYDPIPQTNGKHWWLWVDCPKAVEFRQFFGLPETHCGSRLHLTFAVPHFQTNNSRSRIR